MVGLALATGVPRTRAQYVRMVSGPASTFRERAMAEFGLTLPRCASQARQTATAELPTEPAEGVGSWLG